MRKMSAPRKIGLHLVGYSLTYFRNFSSLWSTKLYRCDKEEDHGGLVIIFWFSDQSGNQRPNLQNIVKQS